MECLIFSGFLMTKLRKVVSLLSAINYVSNNILDQTLRNEFVV